MTTGRDSLDTDSRLIQQALDGKSPARDALVKRLTPVIWAHTRRALRRQGVAPEPHAPDLTQHIWLKLWAEQGRVLRRFEPRKASLEHYVGGVVTRSEVGDWLRSRRTARRGANIQFVPLDVAANAGMPGRQEQRVADADLVQRLFVHLDTTLEGRGRLVFRMLYQDQLDPSAIASALGVKPHVVHNWQARIRKKARAFASACVD